MYNGLKVNLEGKFFKISVIFLFCEENPPVPVRFICIKTSRADLKLKVSVSSYKKYREK